MCATLVSKSTLFLLVRGKRRAPSHFAGSSLTAFHRASPDLSCSARGLSCPPESGNQKPSPQAGPGCAATGHGVPRGGPRRASEARVSWITAERSGSGGERRRLAAHHAQRGPPRSRCPPEQVRAARLPAERREAPTPEPGVPGGVRPAARGGRLPKNTQNRAQVSITPPQVWVKRSPSSCGKVSKNCPASRAKGRGPLVLAGRDQARRL